MKNGTSMPSRYMLFVHVPNPSQTSPSFALAVGVRASSKPLPPLHIFGPLHVTAQHARRWGIEIAKGMEFLASKVRTKLCVFHVLRILKKLLT